MEEHNRYPVAVIGDFDSVVPFAAIGFDVFYETDPQQAGARIKRFVRDGKYAIIYLVEPLYAALSEWIESLGDLTLPAIIVIPSVDSSGDVGVKQIRNFVERAVGADILFKE